MSIRKANGEKFQSFENGVDNTTALDTPRVKGTLSKALNTDLVDESLLKKRAGYSTVSTWGSRNIRGGFEYRASDGTNKILLYGEDAVLTGTSGVLGYFSGTSTPTTIASGLKDGVKPSILQYRDLAFIFNGTNNFLYNGTTYRQIGIDGPVTAPQFLGNAAGSLVANGSYLFGYSYYNTQTGAESNVSPISESMVAGADSSTAGITISLTAGDSTLADKIRIYRSVPGGNVLFRETEIAISSTSYTSTTLDSGLGTELELDNSRLSTPASFGVINDNRIFAAGFSNNPNRVAYSKVGISGPMPESFQALDFVDCNINDGDRILGLGKAGTTVIVIKERSVGRLIRIESNIGGLERQGSQKYLYEEISSEVTGLSHHLILSLDNIIIWMGRDDIYATDGSQIFRLGGRVRKTIQSLDFSQAHKWSSLVKTDTHQIIFSVTPANKLECDFQFIGHYRNFPNVAWTFYSAGPNTSTHPGLVVGSLFQVTVNRLKKFYFGSAQASGKIYTMDSGDNDDSYGIYWDVRLAWDGGPTSAAKKMYHSYYLFAAGAGKSPNNTITHTFEVDTTEVIVKTSTASLIGSTTTWHGTGATWGDFNWGSVSFNPIRFFPKIKAYFGRYGFSNTYANQPVAVRALTSISQLTPIHK